MFSETALNALSVLSKRDSTPHPPPVSQFWFKCLKTAYILISQWHKDWLPGTIQTKTKQNKPFLKSNITAKTYILQRMKLVMSPQPCKDILSTQFQLAQFRCREQLRKRKLIGFKQGWSVFFLLVGTVVAACGTYFPDQGLNPGLLHWVFTILATGPPVKSQGWGSFPKDPT